MGVESLLDYQVRLQLQHIGTGLSRRGLHRKGIQATTGQGGAGQFLVIDCQHLKPNLRPHHLGDIPSATLTDGIEPISISGGDYQGKPNPHAWMSLDNALIYVDNIATALATTDPANAATYAANAEAYKARLIAEIGPLKDQIATLPENRRWLATCEGAFSYLARDLGLTELYLWPINSDQQGSPRQVQAVIDGVREHAIPAVFCESTVSSAPAEQVARETGAAFGGVLYVDSLSEADGPVPTYLDLLKVTTETIARGLTPAE